MRVPRGCRATGVIGVVAACLGWLLVGCGSHLTAAVREPRSAEPIATATPIAGNRVNPGVVFIRGSVTESAKSSFVFVSPTKGAFRVTTTELTSYITSVGAVNRSAIRVGAHVGVHGYEHGPRLTAVSVTLYPSSKASVPSGIVFVRGSVTESAKSSFVFVSPTKGAFQVTTVASTTYMTSRGTVSRSAIRVGAHVGVHGYEHGSRLTAVRVTLYPSSKPAVPKEATYRGSVVSAAANSVQVTVDGREYDFVLARDGSVVYRDQPTSVSLARRGQRVDVRAYHSQQEWIATRIELLVEKVHHPPTVTEYGIVGSTSITGFVLQTISGGEVSVQSSLPVQTGEEVSVHGRETGSHFTATQVFHRTSLPVRTTLVKGVIIRAENTRLVVDVGGHPTTFVLEPFTSVSGSVSSGAVLSAGRRVSVRFWLQGSRSVATSIHVYISAASTKTRTGTIVSIGRDQFQMADRGIAIAVTLTKVTIVTRNGVTTGMSGLAPGERVQVTGALTGDTGIKAQRVDILSETPVSSSHPPESFQGIVTRVNETGLSLTLSSGTTVLIALGRSTAVVVHGASVPSGWLFAGPSATVSAKPGLSHSIEAVQIIFHPILRSLTGNVVSATSSETVLETRGTEQSATLTVAKITDDGASATTSALLPGLKASVSGFPLPSGVWAALTVTITHPILHVSGVVASVDGDVLGVRRASGELIVVHFPAAFVLSDSRSSQTFQPSQIPLGSKLSVVGSQQAGWLLVQTAGLTVSSLLLAGTVSAIGPSGTTVTIKFATGGSTVLSTAITTKYTVGREPATFADIELNDIVSVRAYPAPAGGYLASSLDLQRKLEQRSGISSNITATSLQLLARQGTISVYLLAYTVVYQNDVEVPISDLQQPGVKLKVEGHVRPDGAIDATKITIEG